MGWENLVSSDLWMRNFHVNLSANSNENDERGERRWKFICSSIVVEITYVEDLPSYLFYYTIKTSGTQFVVCQERRGMEYIDMKENNSHEILDSFFTLLKSESEILPDDNSIRVRFDELFR